MTTLADQLGRVLGGRYRLEAGIGVGASAFVYAATDVSLGRLVAVKVLQPGLAGDEAFLRRFRAEAQAVAALEHPHVLRVLDWGEDADGAYLVLEHMRGGSLRRLLDTGVLLDHAQAVRVGAEAADGLAYAHRRGLVHRDVKPGNLLLDGAGHIRVADFGMARALAEAAWTEPLGAVLGSARYASPEQAEGRPLDDRCDVYSLALVLYEALVGRVPFGGDTTVATMMARVGASLPRAPELGPLAPILAQAAIPEPLARLDAAELAHELETLARTLPPPRPLWPEGAGDPGRSTTLPVPEPGPARPPLPERRPPRHSRLSPPRATAVDAGPAAAGGAAAGAAAAGPAAVAAAAGAAGAAAAAGAAGAAAAGAGAVAAVAPPAPSPSPAVAAPTLTPPAVEAGSASPGWDETAPTTAVQVIPEPAAERSGPERPARPPRQRRSRRRRRLLVTTLVVAILAVAGALSARAYRRDVVDGHHPPSVRGEPLATAQALVQERGLRLVVVRQLYSATSPAGVVLSQSPAPLAGLAAGSKVRVTVSLGHAPVVLPAKLAGQPRAEVVAALEHRHFVPVLRARYDNTVAAGDVLSLAPSSGSHAYGSRVRVLVSRGPAPRTIPPLASGAGWTEEGDALNALGLDPIEQLAWSSTVPAGEVISTAPAPGTTGVAVGSTVEVTVSRGPQLVAVPAVAGDTIAAAVAAIDASGLQVSEQVGPPFSTKATTTDPAAGTQLRPGSSVTLYVA